MTTRKKVVLAYSGGLDTSVAIPYLSERGYDVIAVAVNVGQPGDLRAAVERAPVLGAVDARLVEAKSNYADGFVLPALMMNALYQDRYPLVSALSRPLIAGVLVDVAGETGAVAVRTAAPARATTRSASRSVLVLLLRASRCLRRCATGA
jgi:argininosuccinate synthase